MSTLGSLRSNPLVEHSIVGTATVSPLGAACHSWPSLLVLGGRAVRIQNAMHPDQCGQVERTSAATAQLCESKSLFISSGRACCFESALDSDALEQERTLLAAVCLRNLARNTVPVT